jgi:hypothetical protein
MTRTPGLAATLLLLLLLLLSATGPAAAKPAGQRSRTGPVSPQKTLSVKWRLSPLKCYVMKLTAEPSTAPLRVKMVDGKVFRTLRSDGEPIVQRLCSGSNALGIQLHITSTVEATASVTLTSFELDLPPRKQDPGRDTWDPTVRLFQTPYPEGTSRTLLGPTGRILGRRRAPLAARLDLQHGRCYRLQVRAQGQPRLQLMVFDADEIPLLTQPLAPRELHPTTSDKICPRRTGPHHLVLALGGDHLPVAWRLVGP